MKFPFKLFSKQRAEKVASFSHIMTMAEKIARRDIKGLHLLVRALLRPLQAEHLLAVAEREQHQAPSELNYLHFFFNLNTIAQSSDFYLSHKPVVHVDLSADIVLPTPWHRDRFASALSSIGSGKANGTWRQDNNHRVAVWLPWKIGFVNGGNHSITTGILAGEGELIADEVYDLSSLFDRVICDGHEYREISSGRILGTVSDPRRAAVFEIGRLMVKAGTAQLVEECIPAL